LKVERKAERQLGLSNNPLSLSLRGVKRRSNLGLFDAGLPRPFRARNDGYGKTGFLEKPNYKSTAINRGKVES